ncbi:MAG: hypothetical protein K0R57_39 [Paenibacillaceae bacterium]|nr:hypothetical protein [Paenibacillaceae bacterium]
MTISRVLARPVMELPPAVQEEEVFTVEYGLDASGSQGGYGHIKAMDITMTYDQAQLEFVSAAAVDGHIVLAQTDSSVPGEIRFIAACTDPEEGFAVDGTVLAVSMRAKQAGAAELGFSKSVASNKTGLESHIPSVSGELQIQP